MIGTVEVKCCAAQPQKPLSPCFAFKDSPQSIRALDVPKAIGNWAITRVYIDVLYPDNTTKEVDCVRTGNVWVGTFEGSTLAGRVTQGYQIKADGVDENENPITGYVLGCGDVYVLDDTNDIKALVGKTALRMLDDIPSTPAKGDVVIVNGVMKIYDGEEWVTISGGNDDTYTKAEIDEMVDEIDSSISALGDEIPTKTSDLENDSGFLTSTSTTITDIQDDVDAVENSLTEVESSVSELNTTMGELESSMSELESSMTSLESSMTELESSMTELETTVSDLDELAVKYDDDDKTDVHLGVAGRAFTLSIPDNGAGNGKIQFRGVNHISRNSMTLGVADTGETVGNTHVQLGDSHAPQAQLDIGANIQILSFNEEGKSQIQIDGERLVVVTPEDVAEGKTLVATFVPDTPINSISTTRGGETMAKRDNPEGHWEYVSADLPSKTSDLTNDSDFITEDDVADKRDYDDLTYGGTYDPTDAEGYYGITSWHIAGYKYNGQTLPAFDTSARFKNNQTYGTGWNDGSKAIHTSPSNPSDFSTLYLDGFGNAEPVPFTLSLDKTTYEFSFMGSEQQNLTLTANLANSDSLALGSELSNVEENAKSAWRVWEYDPLLPGLTFTAEEANSTVGMHRNYNAPAVSLEYSTDDGTTWSDFVVDSTTVTLAHVGDRMLIRAKTTNERMGSSSAVYNKFVMTGKIAASGSVMYLLKKEGDLDTISSNECFGSLFKGCTSLTTAPELTATTLAQSCYAQMFQDCSSLTSIKLTYTGNFSGTGVPNWAFSNWVQGVASTGTFYYNGSDTARGQNAIPDNWTVQTF